ncbi:hypothetical protein EJ08DRAFT_666346 [Tothia fuscella]|uniref:Uncharacterized protein n=1 Tax=Tothia fuscella TaxID=1048955 RepID=A0A9P4TSX2_9PEZI|nr:hypothetical protein EJ08DRAFT_666346 [Tothia fuscella]
MPIQTPALGYYGSSWGSHNNANVANAHHYVNAGAYGVPYVNQQLAINQVPSYVPQYAGSYAVQAPAYPPVAQGYHPAPVAPLPPVYLSEEQLKLPPVKQIIIPMFEVRDYMGRPIPPDRTNTTVFNSGVLRITQGPFNVRPNDVLVILGAETAVVEYPQASGIYAIHIIQERQTGKTTDIFVELKDWDQADRCNRRFNNLQDRGRDPKLGSRKIKVTMSTNSELMRAIFPLAKCEWVNGMPERTPEYVRDHGSEWDGFVTSEELVKVLLFCEQPRSAKTRFAVESPQRVYQFMMTTLQKIPWTANRKYFPKPWVGHLHKVLHRMAVRLANLVKDQQHVNLDAKLLIQFMITLRSTPMYAYDKNDLSSSEKYMEIARVVDKVMADGFNQSRRALMTGSANPHTGDPSVPSGFVQPPLQVIYSQAGYSSVPRQSDDEFYRKYGRTPDEVLLHKKLEEIAFEAETTGMTTPTRKSKANATESSDDRSESGYSTGPTYMYSAPSGRAKSATFSAGSSAGAHSYKSEPTYRR